MKASSFFIATLVLSLMLFCSQSFAQSSGIASSKQKQAALDKQRAHQADLKRKYKALPPEQAAEAKKKAREYKNGGYRKQPDQGVQTSSETKPVPVTPVKPYQKGTINTKPSHGKPTGTQTRQSVKAKPILMDAEGKPLSKTTPVVPAKKGVQKPNSSKPSAEIVKSPAVETIKK